MSAILNPGRKNGLILTTSARRFTMRRRMSARRRNFWRERGRGNGWNCSNSEILRDFMISLMRRIRVLGREVLTSTLVLRKTKKKGKTRTLDPVPNTKTNQDKKRWSMKISTTARAIIPSS